MDKPRHPFAKSHSYRRKPLITLLEPRILLDGAAVSTSAEMATDVAYQQDPVHNSSPDNEKTTAEIAPASENNEANRREIAFVDTQIKDYEILVDGIKEGVEVYLINGSENGLEAILATLDWQNNIDAIHIFSHGDTGELTLGSLVLNSSNLDENSVSLQKLGESVSEQGDVLLYGCSVGSDDSGREFINRLSELTKADIAASDDLTGSAVLGGDWDLEVSTENIESTIFSVSAFDAVLAPSVSGLSDQSIDEQDPAITVSSGTNISGGDNYGNGYIEFDVSTGGDAGDQFGLSSSANPNNNGEISISGNQVFLGQGSSKIQIGTVDATFDGTNGKAFRINLINATVGGSSPVLNGDFSSGLDNWTAINGRVDFGSVLTGTSIATPLDNQVTYPSKTPGSNDGGSLSGPSSGWIVQVTGGELLLEAKSMTIDSYGVVHGPAAYSDSFSADAGMVLKFDWEANNGGDDYHVAAYLVDSNNNITMALDDTGSIGFGTADITVPTTGTYRFVFVSGTFDASGGQAAGASMLIDNIRVEDPIVTDAVVQSISRQVTYTNTSDAPVTNKTITLTTKNSESVNASNTFSLTVAADNDAPVVSDAIIAITDTSGADTESLKTGSFSFSDPDDNALTFSFTNSANAPGAQVGGESYDWVETGTYGTLYLKSDGSYAFEPNNAAINGLTADITESFNISAVDAGGGEGSGAALGDDARFTVNITATNDIPLLSAPSDSNYGENDNPISVGSDAVISDAENTGLQNAAVSITAGLTSGDLLAFVNNDAELYGSITASFEAGVLTLAGAGTVAQYQNALRTVTYSSSSDDPTGVNSSGSVSRTLSWSINDGAVDSELGTSQINITAVNDTPDVTDTTETLEDTAGADIFATISGSVSASDKENDSLTYAIKSNSGSVTTLAGLYGTLTINNATGAYSYDPDETAVNALDANASDTFTIQVSDGNLTSELTWSVNITAEVDSPVSYTEQADATEVLSNTVIASDASLSYSGGYIDFDVNDPSSTEQIALLTSSVPDVANGVVTVVGNAVYLGDGAIAKVIGSVDSIKNGKNGNPLRINFSVDFENGNFEDVSDGVIASNTGTTVEILGWNIVNDRVTLGATPQYDYGLNEPINNTIAGLATPEDPTYPTHNINKTNPNISGVDSSIYEDGMKDIGNLDSTGYKTSIAEGAVSNQGDGNSLEMWSSHWSKSGYEVIRGPYVYSQGTVALEAGDDVSFFWKAEGGGDAYDVFGYIVDVNTNETQIILNETGASASAQTDWAKEAVTVDSAGEYRFVFVSGTFDATGGRLLGAQLYIDDVEVTQANPPGNITSSVLQELARKVTYQNSSDLSANNAEINKTLTITTVANDATTHSATQALTISEVNDNPSLESPATIYYTDTEGDDVFNATGGILAASDPDSETVFEFSIDGGVPENEGQSYSLEGNYGTLTVNSTSGEYSYSPNSSAINALSDNVTDTFTLRASDGDAEVVQQLRIEITSVNDAPLLGGEAVNATYVENSVPVQIDAGITVTDPEGNHYGGGSLTVSLGAGGESEDRLDILNLNGVSVNGGAVSYAGVEIGSVDPAYDGSSGILRIELNSAAYSAQVEALVRAVAFTHLSDNPSSASRTVNIALNDGGSGGSVTPRLSTKELQIAVQPVNDAPEITGSNDSYVTEKIIGTNPGGEFVINGLSLSDVDNTDVTVVFSLKPDGSDYYGTLTFDTSVGGGLAGSSLTGNGTGQVTYTGSIEALNKTLDGGGLKYKAEDGYDFVAPGPDLLTISAVDESGGNTVLNQQVIVIPAIPNADSDNIIGQEDSVIQVDLTGLITDINDNGGTFSFGTGTPDDSGGDGGSITPFSGNEIYADYDIDRDGDIDSDDTSKVIGYSLTEGQLILDDSSKYIEAGQNYASFVFIPEANWNGVERFIYQYTSGANEKSLIAEIAIYVTPVNDAPVVEVTENNITIDEDNSLIFGSGQSHSITLADVDFSGTELMDMTISAPNGAFALGSVTGLSVLSGGNNSGSLTVRGTLTDLQAAVEGLSYQPNSNFNGSDEISITLADLGDTGSGGAKSATQTISLTINPVNDAPIAVDNFGGIAVESGGENNGVTGSVAASILSILSNDTDVDAGDTLRLTMISTVDSVQNVTAEAVTIDGLYGSLTINPAGDYTYVADDNNPDVQALRISGQQLIDRFNYTVTDSGNLTDQAELSFIIDGRNDQPVALDTNIDEKWSFGKEFYRDISEVFMDVDSPDNGETLDYVINGLPKGLTYNPQTGVVSGIPTTIGKFIITMTASDQMGASATRSYLLEIVAPAKDDVASVPNSGQEVPAPEVDRVQINNQLTAMPQGLVDSEGTLDGTGDSGFMPFKEAVEFEAEQTEFIIDDGVTETGQSDEKLASVPSETIIFEKENTRVTRITGTDGSQSLRASIDVNVDPSGNVVFSDVQQQAFDAVSISVSAVEINENNAELFLEDSHARSVRIYAGTLADGSTLPEWITVNPKNGNVSVTPPLGQEDLDIRVHAIGTDGRVRTLELKLDMKELMENKRSEASLEKGFISLNDQLATADPVKDQAETLVAQLKSLQVE